MTGKKNCAGKVTQLWHKMFFRCSMLSVLHILSWNSDPDPQFMFLILILIVFSRLDPSFAPHHHHRHGCCNQKRWSSVARGEERTREPKFLRSNCDDAPNEKLQKWLLLTFVEEIMTASTYCQKQTFNLYNTGDCFRNRHLTFIMQEIFLCLSSVNLGLKVKIILSVN